MGFCRLTQRSAAGGSDASERLPGRIAAMIADEATFARLMVATQAGDRRAYTVLLTEAQSWLERYFRRPRPH